MVLMALLVKKWSLNKVQLFLNTYGTQQIQWLLLLTWINFNPSMDK